MGVLAVFRERDIYNEWQVITTHRGVKVCFLQSKLIAIAYLFDKTSSSTFTYFSTSSTGVMVRIKLRIEGNISHGNSPVL